VPPYGLDLRSDSGTVSAVMPICQPTHLQVHQSAAFVQRWLAVTALTPPRCAAVTLGLRR
jgi:hypothetical protein